jgi:hypothetical protein
VRAGQDSAEAIVAKKGGESRQERRAEEPRDQPTNSGKERSEKSSETVLERQLKVTSRIGLEGKREWNSLANQQTGGEPAARRTRCTKDLQRFNRRMRKTARPVVWEGHGAQSPRLDPILETRFRRSAIIQCPQENRAGNPIFFLFSPRRITDALRLSVPVSRWPA